MKLFFLLLLYCTDTNGDGVDLESPQGLDSDIPTVPEVNIHVHLWNFLVKNPIPEDMKLKKDTCYHLEHIDPVKEAFPFLRECLTVVMTFGNSTATVECSFSSFCHIKTYLCSIMSQERMDSLALLSIERSLSYRLWDCKVCS